MTHSLRWLLVLSVSVIACGAATGLYAQDDLEALLKIGRASCRERV